VQLAIDDSNPLLYGEVLPDDYKETTVGYRVYPLGLFYEQGITCSHVLLENDFSFRSGEWLKASRALEIKPICTKLHSADQR
jgi:hypothetical protein